MSAAKVFIIEDEPDLVRALVMRLKAEGYQTACTMDGASAADRVQAEKPDLILLDICLPKCDGFVVFQQLRQNPATEHIPIAFLTAHSAMEDRQKARHLGAAGYIVKPFQWNALMQVIREILATHPSKTATPSESKDGASADLSA